MAARRRRCRTRVTPTSSTRRATCKRPISTISAHPRTFGDSSTKRRSGANLIKLKLIVSTEIYSKFVFIVLTEFFSNLIQFKLFFPNLIQLKLIFSNLIQLKLIFSIFFKFKLIFSTENSYHFQRMEKSFQISFN